MRQLVLAVVAIGAAVPMWSSYHERTTPAGRLRTLSESFYRFPASLWRDPLAAIVEKELRSLARTPRYRMVFVMGFSFGLMVWLPMILGGRANRHTGLGWEGACGGQLDCRRPW